ncbi:FAD-dependent oxidoreductase [Roseomonas sp. ACRSG]|nr:FAD-dependent oxidoreductase [Roseomonas sp. ACRSG]
MTRDDVLVVGAGPTGLVLALWLTAQGVKVRIIDKAAAPGTTSRAMAVQARTLELYRQLDLAEAVAEAGRRNPALNLWVRGRRKARLSFGSAGAALTPYPFLLIYPQDQHEQLLASRLEAMGVAVERQTELLDFEDRGGHVAARLRGPGGEVQGHEARFLAGCDGARSTTRHRLGLGFEGGTYDQIFYVADVEAGGPAADGELHLSLEQADFVALLAYGRPGQGRLIGTVRGEREAAETLGFADVGQRAIESLGLRVERVNWFSTYRVHHRVTDHYRRGQVFLLGDAAHIHSPAGGQGMNTGIGDAVNLAWKLAAVLKGQAPDSLLDSYEAERLPFARRLVATTDRIFSLVSAEGALADLLRIRVAPVLAATAFGAGPAREAMFRLLSQTGIRYREGPLSRGMAGRVRGGDRLPWVAWDGGDNFAPLRRIGWQVHVYGTARDGLRAWCEGNGLPLHVFAWHPRHGKAGFARDAAYLVRPDTYVALAEPEGEATSLARYFSERAIVPAGA